MKGKKLMKTSAIRNTTTGIVPNFDAETPAGRKLAVICSQGSLDMAFTGLVLANAALGEAVETHILFTSSGVDVINKETKGSLQLSVDSSATDMPEGLGGVPIETAIPTARLEQSIAEFDAPEVPELLAQIVDSGGHIWACSMSAEMNDLTKEDLYDEVEGLISASDFIDKTEGAQFIFI